MKMRAFGRRGASIVLYLAVSAPAAPAAAGTFDVELTGMVAIANTGDLPYSPRVALLVNSYSTVKGKRPMIEHIPKLELRCADLSDPQLQAFCRTWPEAPCGRRSLDLTEGWEVSFQFSASPLDPPNHLDLSQDFTDLVVGAKDVSDGIADAELLRWEALSPGSASDFALARAFLDQGTLNAIPQDPNYSEWKFKTSFLGKSKKTYPSVAGHLLWRTSLADSTTVDIKLTPYARTGSPIVLRLAVSASRVVLSNEPDDDQFCEHSPKSALSAYTHFSHFWQLTAVAPDKFDDLPFPYSLAPSLQCKDMGMAPVATGMTEDVCALGRHTDCMMFNLDGIQSNP